ncbi:hypothetical protein F2Q68_00030303 [Brassica cretica]|uniref:eRF1/Pelota-like N-terminal domain-containing protein n=1 Tax=Brassica cretica TaxID=69181 RepID=A0A8S9GFV3_BRACR|nr:hypothetical protein F2Q68_00030303 [Brassica cretica]
MEVPEKLRNRNSVAFVSTPFAFKIPTRCNGFATLRVSYVTVFLSMHRGRTYLLEKMKIVRRDFVRDGPGSVKMVAEDSDDLWYAYNLVSTGDSVMAVTFRKVQREVPGGGRDSERVRLKLEVHVEEVDYDKDASVLRIRGKNILENEHVKIGAFHTLEIDLKRPFVLRKAFWDSLALDTLKQASDPAASSDLAVVLMQEGLGQIFLALKKFFENVLQAFVKHVDFSVVRCAVIASPGFTKDQFHRHLLLEAERRQLRAIIENKSRIILVHTNSGYRHSLGEVLNAPNVMNMIKDTKAAKERTRIFHCFKWIDVPNHCGAHRFVTCVLLFLHGGALKLNSDVKTRKKYVDLVESVKDSGGEAFIFSSMHVSGEQLAQLTGIAALLRFPLPDLEDIEM